MKKKDNLFARNTSRRAFLTTGTVAAGDEAHRARN